MADTVVVDALAPRDLLEELRPGTEVIDASKRRGLHVMSQEEIPGCQRVDDNHVRPAQQLQASGGDEAAAAWAAAHEGHPAIRGTRGTRRASGAVGYMGRDVVGHASAPA